MKLEFSRQISKKYSNIKFHENHPVGAELFHGDRQMNRHDKANSCFHNFVNAPKNRRGNFKIC